MADKQAEIAVLQAIVTGATMQSISHRIQGLVFGSQGFSALSEKYAEHAEEEMGWVDKFANRILDLGGEVKIEAMPETKVYDDVVEYLKHEQQTSTDGIAQLVSLMPVLAEDFVAYEDMKAYIIDEDGDLQDTVQDLDLIELIGLQNWLALKV